MMGSSDTEQAWTTPLRSVSVLVVDDDRDTRELMASVLRRAGYSVRTAGNGEEALGLLHWIRPSVIFLDVHMPVMDGERFREAQRREPALLAIPTVVMTADEEVEPLLDLAVLETMHKPFALDELMSTVKRLCSATD